MASPFIFLPSAVVPTKYHSDLPPLSALLPFQFSGSEYICPGTICASGHEYHSAKSVAVNGWPVIVLNIQRPFDQVNAPNSEIAIGSFEVTDVVYFHVNDLPLRPPRWALAGFGEWWTVNPTRRALSSVHFGSTRLVKVAASSRNHAKTVRLIFGPCRRSRTDLNLTTRLQGGDHIGDGARHSLNLASLCIKKYLRRTTCSSGRDKRR